VVALAACAGGDATGGGAETTPAKHAPIARTPGPMATVRPTRMGAALAAAGLDVRALPPLESLAPGPKQKVMRTFTESLGIPCLGCHAEDDFPADTRRKRVAKRMYNELVRVLQTQDGQPLYCDSCHDGTLFALDRRDVKVVADYMSGVLVDGLKRVDGRPHDCTTCHDDPPDFHTLTTWKTTTAPDVLARDGSEKRVTVEVMEPRLPAPGPRVPESCGKESSLCPLDRWMRLVIAPAAASGDAAGLVAGLAKVAAMSPDPSWDWARIAQDGADGARRGNVAAATATCGPCHLQYKAPWRERHRTTRLP